MPSKNHALPKLSMKAGWRTFAVPLIVFQLACVALITSIPPRASEIASQTELIGGETVRAIDGDTIVLGTTIIRLEGIDAPEMKQVCQDSTGRDYRCGRSSKYALSALLKAPVTCSPSGKDRYGRTLAYCKSGNVNVNRTMVQEGWAWAFVKYSDRYVGDEIVARAANLGIWSGVGQAPWDWRAAKLAEYAPTGECIIKGNISHGKKTFYLPFHSSYKLVKIDLPKGEHWFCTEDEAITAGWERAMR